jgi:hypothetical protein
MPGRERTPRPAKIAKARLPDFMKAARATAQGAKFKAIPSPRPTRALVAGPARQRVKGPAKAT